MADETRHTGTRDKNYDLISSMYHILHGAENVVMYIEDAEKEGDKELAEYFRSVQNEYRTLADKGKKLLGDRFGSMTP